MPSRLTVADSRLFPVQTFFNAVGDASFVRMADCLTRGIGFVSDAAGCSFPSDLEPDEEPFDGVRFSLFEDQVVISVEQLRRFLAEAIDAYTKNNAPGATTLSEYLSREIPA